MIELNHNQNIKGEKLMQSDGKQMRIDDLLKVIKNLAGVNVFRSTTMKNL